MGLSNEIVIEVCATSLMSAIAAEKGGAKRIELCDNISEGGTTPSSGLIKLAKENLNLDVCVLIRPRGGDFLYNDYEFDLMKNDIQIAKDFGADGVVTGILDMNGEVDIKRMQELINIARPMQFVFHRAFDMCADPIFSLNQLIELNIDRLLTSGQQNKAIDGAGLIKTLIDQAEGKIDIMPGSGINTQNFIDLKNATGAKSFHLTGRSLVKGNMFFKQDKVLLNDFNHNSDYEWLETNSNIIKQIVELSRM